MSIKDLSIRQQKLYCYFVHLLTASGAILGMLALYKIHKGQIFEAFIYIFFAIFVDAIDGTFARRVDIKKLVPYDGALMDNIIDFLNYVIVPCFLILSTDLVHTALEWPLIVCIIISSTFQFCRTDAKTDDHFFLGFPSYWNILVFYLYYWQTSNLFNEVTITICIILVFVPIKYIYPSRLTNFSKSKAIRLIVLISTILWGFASLLLLLTYPEKSPILNGLCIFYMLLYLALSLYRTFKPIE